MVTEAGTAGGALKPLLLCAAAGLFVAACSAPQAEKAGAQAPVAEAAAGAYLPDPGRPHPTRVLWGDQHVHTGLSMDAGIAGTTLGPEEAVRFARGEAVTSSTGSKLQLSRPLDWVAVTDHSDALGTIAALRAGDPVMMANPMARRWHDMMLKGGEEATQAKRELVKSGTDGTAPRELADPKHLVTAWEKTVDVMEAYNEPGRFTAFIAYEWSAAPNGRNLHRNVIFRDDADKTRSTLPLTSQESRAPGRPGTDPESLWKWLADYEAKTGGKVLAIPHNGNLSNGAMFAMTRLDGSPLTPALAEERARFERLYELYQYKGSSEVNPGLAPGDEFANFGIWDTADLGGNAARPESRGTEYWRDALANGMVVESRLGANPHRFGAAAGTDTHTALAAYEEKNFGGKFADSEPSNVNRWNNLYKKEAAYIRKDWTMMAQGITGVWANANTRAALWDAMHRRETYASTGPRIVLRLFGGFRLSAADLPDMAAAGYARGVPMGGDLKGAKAGQAPTFLVSALKDPDGANLDRLQVVKLWVDADGRPRQKIHDVAWGDNRKPGADGRLPAVGNTVDVKTATYRNSIGTPELMVAWKDPDFDPRQRAVWYVRAIEIPTPRWTAYDAAKHGLKMGAEVDMVLQERAVSSPIWYVPG
jgi:hypothetical protein